MKLCCPSLQLCNIFKALKGVRSNSSSCIAYIILSLLLYDEIVHCSFQFVLEIDRLADCLSARESQEIYIANFVLIKSSNLIHLDSFAIVRFSFLYSTQPLTVTVAKTHKWNEQQLQFKRMQSLMKRRLMINKMLVFLDHCVLSSSQINEVIFIKNINSLLNRQHINFQMNISCCWHFSFNNMKIFFIKNVIRIENLIYVFQMPKTKKVCYCLWIFLLKNNNTLKLVFETYFISDVKKTRCQNECTSFEWTKFEYFWSIFFCDSFSRCI